ncbi:MAG: ammonia permease [Elusimicrobia bacterium RIFCSPLOWO2_01_FULL_60_11]|nr:MAG: ammonia permease [Elusimicrobia bacterium RIFCSPLOWO2_01_FULL_60_11]
MKKKLGFILGLAGMLALAWAKAHAEDAAAAAPAMSQEVTDMFTNNKVAMDTLWTCVAAMLVFWMNAGFAMLEAGLQQAKNCVNICAKNFVVFAVSSLAFWLVGYGLMFGDGNPFIGLKGIWMLLGPDNSPATGAAYQGVYNSMSWATVPMLAKFFFQVVFAGTTATIVSGAVGGRIKFNTFVVFSFILVAIMYPITGHWIWGGGWLAVRGFWDFSGSTVIHSVGGWASLAGVMVLGPRIGKYRSDGSVNPIMGHNMAIATLGCLILWLGWFGFNPGSTMAASPNDISRILITTNMAAAAGTMAAYFTAWAVLGKPDLSMILNGCLAGLVAITAPCAWVGVGSSIIIGAVGGVLVVFVVLLFDKLKLDDPVGVFGVHLANGIWGTLSLGLFASAPYAGGAAQPPLGLLFGGGMKGLIDQAVGVATVGVFTFVVSYIVWSVLKAVIGIRVSREEEIRGLDIGEHGMEAYADFQIFTAK